MEGEVIFRPSPRTSRATDWDLSRLEMSGWYGPKGGSEKLLCGGGNKLPSHIVNGRRLKLIFGILAMAMLAIAIACGSDDDDSEPVTTAPTTAAAPATATAQPAATETPPTSKFTGNLRLGEILIDPPVFLPSKQGWLHGREVTVDLPDGQISGVAAGVDTDGALLVDTGEEKARVVSGSIVTAELTEIRH